MIKGRYVCQIEVDLQINDRKSPFESRPSYQELHDKLTNGWAEKTLYTALGQMFEIGRAHV